MQKRYAPVADRAEPEVDEPRVEVVRTSPGGTVDYGGSKTFFLSRRWEYRRIDRAATAPLLAESELNELGAEGWELAGVVTDAGGTHYFLKRGRG